MYNTFKVQRVKKGLSQKDLAQKLGISPATICRLETGAKTVLDFRLRTIEKLADELELTMSEILALRKYEGGLYEKSI